MPVLPYSDASNVVVEVAKAAGDGLGVDVDAALVIHHVAFDGALAHAVAMPREGLIGLTVRSINGTDVRAPTDLITHTLGCTVCRVVLCTRESLAQHWAAGCVGFMQPPRLTTPADYLPDWLAGSRVGPPRDTPAGGVSEAPPGVLPDSKALSPRRHPPSCATAASGGRRCGGGGGGGGLLVTLDARIKDARDTGAFLEAVSDRVRVARTLHGASSPPRQRPSALWDGGAVMTPPSPPRPSSTRGTRGLQASARVAAYRRAKRSSSRAL